MPLLSIVRRAGIGAVLAAALVCAPALAVSRGTTTDISAAPYMAFLGDCTGTLIAPDRVLTAAHCAPFVDPQDSHVVIGANQVGGSVFVGNVLTPIIPPASAVYAIKGFSGHPGFHLQFPFAKGKPQYATAANDIAIVVLARPVTGVAPVPIATPADAAALEQPGAGVTLR